MDQVKKAIEAANNIFRREIESIVEEGKPCPYVLKREHEKICGQPTSAKEVCSFYSNIVAYKDPGDVEKESEEQIAKLGLESDIVKAALKEARFDLGCQTALCTYQNGQKI